MIARTALLSLGISFLIPAALLCRQPSDIYPVGTYNVGITFYQNSIVRVQISAGRNFSSRTSLCVTAEPQRLRLKKSTTSGLATLVSSTLSVSISLRDGSIVFADRSGRQLLRAGAIDSLSLVSDTAAGERIFHSAQRFELSPGEGVYGLGQYEDPVMNYRGHDVLIAQANRTAVNPFMISTVGYGILWDNYSRSRFHDTGTAALFSSDVADEIDYYFCYGPSMDAVIARYRDLTGAAPLFGKWAYGYWQSKERYTSAKELLDVASEYRTRNIPFDNLVQDWNYWPSPDQFSAMVWDKTRYPSPSSLIDKLHRQHVHLIASIWPAFGSGSLIYKDMKSHGYLYGVPHWNGGLVYDAYSPKARALYWKYIKKGMISVGIDGFWTDGTEPEFRCTDDRYVTGLSMRQAEKNALGTFARYLNTYSLMTNGGIYQNSRAMTGAKRVFQLTRSAFAGQQRYGAVTWSGDTFATWDDLRVQIAAGINFSMSGIPYWNSDIGGFITSFHFPRGYDDPAYRELYVRWFQFGVFSPIFRSHGTNIAREIWRFGEKGDWAYDALLIADRLRYRLMPYIYSTGWKVTNEGYSFMRGLPMGTPDDPKTYGIADQYYFGPSLMVHPVTRPFYYIPAFAGYDITPEHFLSADGKEHGSTLNIYRGPSFDTLALTRKIDVGQIAWYGCIPLGVDSIYSLRITGALKTDTSGMHKFFVRTDGGVRLWMNDTLMIDAWDNRIDTTFTTERVLSSEKPYLFIVEHRQFKPRTANFKINWQKPDTVSLKNKKLETYLPAGTTWYDFWSGESYKGGAMVESPSAIHRIPLYVPAGSIIPLGPEIEYATERTGEPVELRIYTGKDAEFLFYDDEGDSYNYEKGVSAQIPIKWNDATRTLTFGAQKGTYPGDPKKREFNIVLVRPGHGRGIETTLQPDKSVVYKRKALKIVL